MKIRRKRAIFPREKTVAGVGHLHNHEEVKAKPERKVPAKSKIKSPKAKEQESQSFQTRKPEIRPTLK